MKGTRAGLVLLTVALAPHFAAAAEQDGLPLLRSVREIAQFDEETLKRWTALEMPVRIEGRYSAFTPGVIRMQGWDVPLVAKPGIELDRPKGGGRVIEVTGHFALRDEKRVFVVESLRPLPDDRDTFVIRRAAIDSSRAEDLYALGGWARARGRFYGDDELAAYGLGAMLSGFAIERSRVQPHDAPGLWRLLSRAAELDLPLRLREELAHEAWLAKWVAARKSGRNALAHLADRLIRELPGARAPQPVPDELRAAYSADRRTTYSRETDSARRAALHRLLYCEVMLEALQEQIDDDGGNAYRIADRIESLIPERRDVAETMREQRIAEELSRLHRLDQAEMLALARRIRARNQPERARSTIAEWLAFAEARARREGPAELVRVAEQYVTLLEDDAKQLELLVEAHRASGYAADIGLRLEEMGYRLENGRWSRETPSPPAHSRGTAIDAAILEGRVVPGMTPEQVRLAWRAPDAVARAVTAGQVTEVWRFSEPGRSPAVVHFRRSTRQRPETARAVLVENGR